MNPRCKLVSINWLKLIVYWGLAVLVSAPMGGAAFRGPVVPFQSCAFRDAAGNVKVNEVTCEGGVEGTRRFVLSAYCGSAKNCLEMTDQDLRLVDGFTYGACSGGILQYRKGDSVYLFYPRDGNHKSLYYSTGWPEMFCAPDRLIAFFGTRGYFTIYDYPFNSGIQSRKYTPKENHDYYQPPVKLTKSSDSTYTLQDQTKTILFHKN